MNKARTEAALLSISLDRKAKTSLQGQLLQALRELVHAGRLTSGARLPSSRNLAQELAVSRVTTTAVYEQLISEGYLEGQQRLGVFVASDLPDIPVKQKKHEGDGPDTPLPANQPLRPFSVGYPDLSAFPYRDWTRMYDRVWRVPDEGILGQPDPMGFGPLRSAIATHLGEWRGIKCAGEQVIITSGLVDALELVAKAMMKPGDNVLVEEPGHKVLVNALNNVGMTCRPVPVDAHGFDLSAIPNTDAYCPVAVAVTPSRQYPLGMTLSLTRRLELLDWAKSHNGIILEDDYDGEFRYQGQPLPAMMSLDNDQRVIYIGSFSKVMFPALRLGYMVLPERIVPLVAEVLSFGGSRAAQISQPVLAQFMREGVLATHIRRMRRLYGERQKALVSSLRQYAAGLLTADLESGGMHLVAGLDDALASRLTDKDVSELAADCGLNVAPLSSFFLGQCSQQGLIMGYAAFSSQAIERGVRELAVKLREKTDSHFN